MKEALKARQADMLKYLIRAGTPLDVEFFKEKFEKQDRTIRYDLGELKEICARHGIEICYQTKQGYYIPATQKSRASTFLVQCEIPAKTGLGDSSEEERFESLFLYLFVQTGYVTSEKMATTYYFSRSTLSRTLGKMESWFGHAFSLEIRKASGYRLKGEEMTLRRMAAKILAARFRGSYTVEDWFMLLPQELKGKLRLQDVAEISQNIRGLNSKYNVWISNASYLNLLCYCMVRRIRMRMGCVIEEPVGGGEELEGYSGEFLEELFGSEERATRGELEAFSKMLRENGVYIQKGCVEEAKLDDAIHKILIYIEKKMGKGSFHMESLYQDLFDHLRNFLYLSVQGKIEEENPYVLEEVKEHYYSFVQKQYANGDGGKKCACVGD